MRKIIQKIDFWGVEVVKTTSRWFFWPKSIFQNFRFFENFFQTFSKIYVTSAWKKIFFQKIKSRDSQLSYALSSAKKY